MDKFVEAGKQAGFPLTNDFNGKQQEGFLDMSILLRDLKDLVQQEPIFILR